MYTCFFQVGSVDECVLPLASLLCICLLTFLIHQWIYFLFITQVHNHNNLSCAIILCFYALLFVAGNIWKSLGMRGVKFNYSQHPIFAGWNWTWLPFNHLFASSFFDSYSLFSRRFFYFFTLLFFVRWIVASLVVDPELNRIGLVAEWMRKWVNWFCCKVNEKMSQLVPNKYVALSKEEVNRCLSLSSSLYYI